MKKKTSPIKQFLVTQLMDEIEKALNGFRGVTPAASQATLK